MSWYQSQRAPAPSEFYPTNPTQQPGPNFSSVNAMLMVNPVPPSVNIDGRFLQDSAAVRLPVQPVYNRIDPQWNRFSYVPRGVATYFQPFVNNQYLPYHTIATFEA